jgi:thiol-disulfide isomerase/thioredoxin
MKLGMHFPPLFGYSLALLAVMASASHGATPTAEQALKLTPIQSDADYSRPTPQDAAKCTISAKKIDGQVGWVVEDANGVTLRRFVDTNSDNVVDQWCYYKDGLEVYRDIDSNYNGKADQYRWFNTAGCRWGLDKDEDGRIDSWKAISAEEVTAEVIGAMGHQDTARFLRIALTSPELQSLELGETKTKQLTEKLTKLESTFKKLATEQQDINQDTKWLQFNGNRPGVVPTGTDGSKKDLRVYENVVAIVERESKHGQVQIGTLIQVGDVWRVVDVPQLVFADTPVANSGFFFQMNTPDRTRTPASGATGEFQKLLSQLEGIDAAASKASGREELSKLTAKRFDVLEQIIAKAPKAEDRAMWTRDLADRIATAAQSEAYSDGATRLQAVYERLRKSPQDKDLAAYVRFRQLAAEYWLAVNAPGADSMKIQSEWQKKLEGYVNEHPTSPDAAEAMLQLAITQEFAGQEDDCKKWYNRIVTEFPKSTAAAKAAGAKNRLESVGKVLNFQGRSPKGETISLAKHRGQVVLLQYWATWCEPCKSHMATLKDLHGRFGRQGFTVIGINLDSSQQDMDAYLAENPLPWPQIFEEGGLDSRPANELGILTLPTMLLIDQQGKVVNRSVEAAELEKELKKLLR